MTKLLAGAALVVLTPLHCWTGQSTTATLPPPAARDIDFARDVKPILQVACVRCHGRGNDKGGFRLDTRDLMLKGGDTGAAIVPCRSANSRLVALVAGLEPDMVMPRKGSRLTADQIGVLRAWIDRGAPWDPQVSFARAAPLNVARRTPSPPSMSGGGAGIDAYLAPYFTRHAIAPSAADDATFIRRVTPRRARGPNARAVHP